MRFVALVSKDLAFGLNLVLVDLGEQAAPESKPKYGICFVTVASTDMRAYHLSNMKAAAISATFQPRG